MTFDIIAKNIAEVIDDLYRDGAADRSRERVLELVTMQVRHAITLGYREGKRMVGVETTDEMRRPHDRLFQHEPRRPDVR
jgi:hypothetical protein